MFSLHHLRLFLLGLALLLAATLGWSVARRNSPPLWEELTRSQSRASPPRAPTADNLAARRAAVLARIGEAPEYKPLVERLASAYPSDWNKALDADAQRAVTTRSLDSPDSYVSDVICALHRARGKLAGQAAPDALARVFDAQADLLHALREADPRLCVDFLFGQQSPAFLDFAAKNRPLVVAMASAALEAIADGETSQIAREAPSDSDFLGLEVALARRGLSKDEIVALLDGRLPDTPLDDGSLCNAGLVYLEALKSMPDEARLRIYALAVEAMGRS
jgi:hypothetical protein